MRICLVVIFNHKYDMNIPTLRKIYQDRFSHIRFIVPFYDGDEMDVIPVHYSSYLFQGYVSQAERQLSEVNADYYIFIADDMILNPILSEKNMLQSLGLQGEAMMSDINILGKDQWIIQRISDSIALFTEKRNDVNYKGELLPVEQAFKKANECGFFDYSINNKFRNKGKKLWVMNSSISRIFRFIGTNQLPYPLMYGYSDWFILPKEELHIIAQKMGVFAAMGVFAEVSIPTVMLLYCNKLKFLSQTEFEGGEIWNENELQRLEHECQKDLKMLLGTFPSKKAYIHPIKLSRWRY